jgi:hypothetical protein
VAKLANKHMAPKRALLKSPAVRGGQSPSFWRWVRAKAGRRVVVKNDPGGLSVEFYFAEDDAALRRVGWRKRGTVLPW